MNTFTILILIAIGLFIFSKTTSGFTKYKAAQNALLAKFTFDALDLETQTKIIEQTKKVLAAGGINNENNRFEHLSDREKYSFYALAMAELYIPPALSSYEWQYIKNPFIALSNAENQIQAAKRQLMKTDGIEINI